jgi:hypothetical protein
MWDSMIGADECVDISSHQTLSADKTLRSYLSLVRSSITKCRVEAHLSVLAVA